MYATADRLQIGTIIRLSLELARRRPMPLVVATLLLVMVDSAVAFADAEATANLLSSVVAVGVGYVVLRALLRAEGLTIKEGSFASYFGASLLTSLGAGLGSVLLIVPGLYLFARWSLAPAVILAKGERATDALRSSWQATRPIAWRLVLLWLIYYVVLITPVLALTGVAIIFTTQVAFLDPESLLFTVVGSALLNVILIAGAYLSVAAYRGVFADASTLDAIFG